jgi:hypothetical protein
LQDFKKQYLDANELKGEKLEFTYDLGNMKIDVEAAKERKESKESQVPNEEFLMLKKALEEQKTPFVDA